MLSEIAALTKLGITPGLCMVRGPVLSGWREYHPGIVDVLDRGQARLMDVKSPLRCNIALIHHPMIFAELPAYPVNLRAEHLLLVLQHPPIGGEGQSEYDLPGIMRNIEGCLGRSAMLAPVGPAVRDQLADLVPEHTILGFDWHNLVNDDEWHMRKARPRNDRIVIGRHSRPEARKYPLTLETALEAYPTDPRFDIRMLGADADVLKNRYGDVPAEWGIEAFRAGGVRWFFDDLDYWVFHHGPEWIEAFGIAIVEAALSGVPVILPPHFKRLFADIALFGQPSETVDIIDRLENTPGAYDDHVNRARQNAEKQFGLAAEAARLDQISPLWRKTPHDAPQLPAINPRQKRRVLMMTSNGVGLGHMTRLLAVAKKFGPHVETAFLTMSQAFHLIEEQGYFAQFIPFHRLTGADNRNWNQALTEEISDMIRLFRPDMLVFDGNTPYGGLTTALELHPEVTSIWMRRALWPSDKSRLLDRAKAFDTVIEPGELVARFDVGPTAARRSDTVVVDPILLTQPAERLSREDARAALNIGANETAVGLMLGAGTNFSFKEIRSALISDLKRREGLRLIELVTPVRPSDDDDQDTLEQLETYPSFRYSSAFDVMISSAGYNSFHEAILGAVPSLFVPNQAGEMDRQDIRAKTAKASGWGEFLTREDLIRLTPTLDRMLDPEARASMTARMRRVRTADGALEAAEFIERQLDLLPAHRRMV